MAKEKREEADEPEEESKDWRRRRRGPRTGAGSENRWVLGGASPSRRDDDKRGNSGP